MNVNWASLTDLPREFINTLWVFLAGSVMALFRSIVDGTRRSFKSLVLGCLFGGLGATVAYDMFASSDWRIFWTGCAAVITENFVVGLYNASQKFREHPIETFKDLWAAVTPNLSAVKEFTSSEKTKDDERS